ncbi:hypothetical protein EYF80_048492 [Liparis tanakae]|uniref:Uncharacterized protein n=1 Tax=Liparis tanakae TaxID=230148 RepID=A0A4Z2FKS7_9TELE|nr:hypothetical protein EYF80_048492 [Liparis tanakae]
MYHAVAACRGWSRTTSFLAGVGLISPSPEEKAARLGPFLRDPDLHPGAVPGAQENMDSSVFDGLLQNIEPWLTENTGEPKVGGQINIDFHVNE